MVESPAVSPPRLLLLDDEPVIVATLAEALRIAGFAVSACHSAAQAVELVRAAPFALLRRDRRRRRVRQPFMFLSAYSDPQLVDQAILAGALAYIVKPIDPVQLVPTVRTAITRAREMAALLEQADRLTKAVDANRDVSVAVGLLMAQRGLPRQAAYEALRQHARRHRRRLVEVAAEITSGVEALYGIPTADRPGHPPDTSAVLGEAEES